MCQHCYYYKAELKQQRMLIGQLAKELELERMTRSQKIEEEVRNREGASFVHERYEAHKTAWIPGVTPIK